jgi:2-alkyl-3-oxoalkanoate reductase
VSSFVHIDDAAAATAVMTTESRGASNAKAKRDLGWRPSYPSWRTGFRMGLGSSAATRAA